MRDTLKQVTFVGWAMAKTLSGLAFSAWGKKGKESDL